MNKEPRLVNIVENLILLCIFFGAGVIFTMIYLPAKHMKQDINSFCNTMAYDFLEKRRKEVVEERDLNILWQRIVDIETDIRNLCSLSLEESELKNFKSTVIEKYR